MDLTRLYVDDLFPTQIPVRQSESAKGVRCRMFEFIAEIGFESRQGQGRFSMGKEPPGRLGGFLVPFLFPSGVREGMGAGKPNLGGGLELLRVDSGPGGESDMAIVEMKKRNRPTTAPNGVRGLGLPERLG